MHGHDIIVIGATAGGVDAPPAVAAAHEVEIVRDVPMNAATARTAVAEPGEGEIGE